MLIIGIAGGTGSGKTTLAKALEQELGPQKVAIISQDSYYVNHSGLSLEERLNLNYDHPNAFEESLLITHLRQLQKGQPIQVPVYDFKQHRRINKNIPVKPLPVVIVEGILILVDPGLRSIFDIKVFIDTDADTRVLRRIVRDIEQRGRTLHSVCHQYLTTVKPMHEAFVEPSKRYADIIIPEGGYNQVALGILISWIEKYLQKTGNS